MPVRARRRLVILLVVIFFGQTWLVYSDDKGRKTPPLSREAARGWEVWHDHNCQSCHQIYGFGGFLGPDLTNAARSLTEARLDTILTRGAGFMPAFHLRAKDRRAIAAFLAEVDRTGVSQPRAGRAKPAAEILASVVEEVTRRADAFTNAEAKGYAIAVREKCVSCHLPNLGSPVRAPDLSGALSRLGEERILKTLAEGVPNTVMPKFPFTGEQGAAVIAFLGWLERHEAPVHRAFEATRPEGGSLLRVPWWEFD